MKGTLFFTLLIFSIALSEQDYCDVVNKAYQAETIYRSKENLSEAVKLYIEVFDYGIRNISFVLDAVDCATSIKDTSNAIHFLDYGIKCGISTSSYEKLWKYKGDGMDLGYLLAQIDAHHAQKSYEKTLDNDLIKQMGFLQKRDQEFRGDDIEDDVQMKINDKKNWASLKEIVKTNGGLPGYSQLGNEGSENLDILFYHMDLEPMQFFLPYVIEAIKSNECYFGEVILYQLERIGMNDGVIYTINDDLEIEEHAKRTKINAELLCQSFGEWFLEKHPKDKKLYFVPIDPSLNLAEVNRVRKLFCLDTIESKWARQPWVNVISQKEFKTLFTF